MRISILTLVVTALLLTVACQKSTHDKPSEENISQELKSAVAPSQTDKLRQILLENVREQFGDVEFKITNVIRETKDGNEFSNLEYMTESGVVSHAVLVKVTTGKILVGNTTLETGKTYLVDCFGTCPCIEIYHTGGGGGAGYFTCSCASCRMKLTVTD